MRWFWKIFWKIYFRFFGIKLRVLTKPVQKGDEWSYKVEAINQKMFDRMMKYT